jgi:hypothetical protein
VNERVRAVDTLGASSIEVLCECGRVGCSARVRIAPAAYAQIAAAPGRYVVAATHATAVAELVEAANGYVVLERSTGA